MGEAFDREMMANALRVAERGLGRTAPNPAVGAVIADERTGEVVARGWTQPGGRPHAETEAIRRAGDRARGRTMYVTLEPCAHHGQTPPCAEAIVAAGLTRVVVGTGDPDPRTRGQGIDRLRATGVQVTESVSEGWARHVSLGHILRMTECRPFVAVKMALAGDGTVHFGGGGRPVMVTSEVARARGHLMRAEADAILVGRGTVTDDDPALTCRLPGLAARSPIRVVAASKARGLAGTRLLATARETPLWVVAGPEAAPADVESLEAAGARVLTVPVVAGVLSVPELLAELAHRGITRLLIEGGPAVWKSFAGTGKVDEVTVFHAQVDGMAEDAYRQSVRNALAHYLSPLSLVAMDERGIGSDRMFRFVPGPR